MIGVNVSTPNPPRFVIVNVPPSVSAGRSCPSLARCTSSSEPQGDLLNPERLGVLDHGDEQARHGIDGDADMSRLREVDLIGPLDPSSVQQRIFVKGNGHELDREILKGGNAHGRIPGRLELCPKVDEMSGIRRRHQGDRCASCQALDHPRCDHPPHGTDGDRPRLSAPRRGIGLGLHRHEYVNPTDPSVAPAASKPGVVDSMLPGNPPRQR